jgi:hypothetical protein
VNASASKITAGAAVRTVRGEPAHVYMLAPDGVHAVLVMDDQFMPDGGQAFRTVRIDSLRAAP